MTTLKEQMHPNNYTPLPGSERRPSVEAKWLGPADENEIFMVTIVLRRRPDAHPLPAFEHFAGPPPGGKKRVKTEEFAAKYGAHPEDMERVVKFAKDAGLTVVETHPARRTVVVSGTVALMSKAFGVSLGRYQHTVIRQHYEGMPQKHQETYRGRDGFIHVPEELADVIIGVFGLDNRTITKRNSADPANTSTLTVQEVAGLYNFPANTARGQTIGIISPGGGYFQSDMQQYFGEALPTITPVSIDGFGNGSVQLTTSAATPAGSSVLYFASTAGVMVNTTVGGTLFADQTYWVNSVGNNTVTLYEDVTSPIPAGTTVFFNADGETSQDICIAGAAAPGANIAVYFSNGGQNGWVDTLQRAIHPDAGDPVCSVLSSSFYLSNGDDADTLALAGVTTAMITAISQAFHDAALQHVTVCIASGDTGSNSKAGKFPYDTSPVTYGGDGKAHVQYPGSDPWVLCVGGTTIGDVADNPPSCAEYVWNDPDANDTSQWGTGGGGISDYFDLPSYQSNAAVPKSVNDNTRVGRGVPDVAGNASYNAGYSGLFLAGRPVIGNGTSASAPHWAGLIAVINAALGQPVGFINTAIYQSGSGAFRDINPPADGSGGPLDNSNSGIAGYRAGAGWDACTGWGSPDGISLLNFFQNQLQPNVAADAAES